MSTLDTLMNAVRALRTALYERLDDNLGEHAFNALQYRHRQAVLQARRQTEDSGMSPESDTYDHMIDLLNTATDKVNTADQYDEGAMLAAARAAGGALDAVEKSG